MDISEEDYQKAVAVVRKCLSGSVSNLQRKLYWGYGRAASAIDRMQDEFIVSPMSASGRRDVYPEETHELWKELQAAKAQAVPEGFVLIPKEINLIKADILACAEWDKNKSLFCSENRDMTATQVEEFRLRWCKNKAYQIMSEYKAMIEGQEKAND